MNKLNLSLTLSSIALLTSSVSAYADSWSCRHDNDVREIHIVLETSEPVPCSVVYKKLTEGVEDQILWTANSDANYCEEKAKAFVEKQVSWGWTCVETISDNADEEATAAEDTSTSTEPEAKPAE